MDPRRLLPIVILGEGVMSVVALAWAWWIDLALPLGSAGSGVFWGSVAALTLGVVNLALLHARTNRWPGDALRRVCRVVVRPLFEHVQLLFRGVLQSLVGLPLASLVFGAVHVGGRHFIGYGVWAACIGALLGWLMVVTGGLLAPIVAHAVYDALALAYVRYGPADVCE
jgi:membrane protease YdiL (CAAX protease family)